MPGVEGRHRGGDEDRHGDRRVRQLRMPPGGPPQVAEQVHAITIGGPARTVRPSAMAAVTTAVAVSGPRHTATAVPEVAAPGRRHDGGTAVRLVPLPDRIPEGRIQ